MIEWLSKRWTRTFWKYPKNFWEMHNWQSYFFLFIHGGSWLNLNTKKYHGLRSYQLAFMPLRYKQHSFSVHLQFDVIGEQYG